MHAPILKNSFPKKADKSCPASPVSFETIKILRNQCKFSIKRFLKFSSII